MSIGQVLRETRVEYGLSLQSLASRLYIGKSSLSDYERERIPAPAEVLTGLTQTIDSHRLAMAVANEATGGAAGMVWLDGDVDLHRAVVRDKTLEELGEAMEHLRQVAVLNPPRTVTEDQREAIADSLLELMDSRTAIDVCIDIFCREYGVSPMSIKEAHRQKLESRGYIKPRQIKKKAALKSR